jgi:hypothetical protein
MIISNILNTINIVLQTAALVQKEMIIYERICKENRVNFKNKKSNQESIC